MIRGWMRGEQVTWKCLDVCGGHLSHPCSRMGQMFRKAFRKASPYTFTGGTEKVLNKNNLRLAEVWMDQWKEFFTTVFSSRHIYPGELTSSKQLRTDLGCKSFQWYLENVYPESSLPLNYHHLGEVVHQETEHCLDTMGRRVTEDAGVSPCHGYQAWGEEH